MRRREAEEQDRKQEEGQKEMVEVERGRGRLGKEEEAKNITR